MGTDAVASFGGRCGRTLLQRAAVSVALRLPSVTGQPMRDCTRLAASQLRVSRMRSRVRWLFEQVLPWHSDSSNGSKNGGAQ